MQKLTNSVAKFREQAILFCRDVDLGGDLRFLHYKSIVSRHIGPAPRATYNFRLFYLMSRQKNYFHPDATEQASPGFDEQPSAAASRLSSNGPVGFQACHIYYLAIVGERYFL